MVTRGLSYAHHKSCGGRGLSPLDNHINHISCGHEAGVWSRVAPTSARVCKLHLTMFVLKDTLAYGRIKWLGTVFTSRNCSSSALTSVCVSGGGQETSLIHQDQSIKPQTDSVKGKNNYLCHNNITPQETILSQTLNNPQTNVQEKYLSTREQTEVQWLFCLPWKPCSEVLHGDWDFTHENVRRASSTENKCCLPVPGKHWKYRPQLEAEVEC